MKKIFLVAFTLTFLIINQLKANKEVIINYSNIA